MYTNALSKQYGSVFTWAIASCSFWQKIAGNTTKSMMEIELLVIVDMLKVFKGMLWGHMIKVYFLIKTGSKMPLV